AEANEEKMRFFTNVSHEFRTPITLMLLSVEELLKDQKLSPESQRKIGLVHKNANRILKMVNELLDFRKIDFNKMKLQIAKVDMVKTVKDIVQSFGDIATKKHIDLRVKSNTKSILVPLDIQLFDKVLYNILANAFKFTQDYGFIYVQVNQIKDELVIEVEDSGVGMSKEDLSHVFEAFYQGNNKQINSSGLGLALCKEIVELHQGSIVLQSELRSGTTCKVSLPLTTNHEIEVVDYTVDNNIAKTYIANIPVENGMVIEQKEQFANKERSILVMEDNEDMLSFLTEQLGKTYEVFTANNGKDGFELAIQQVPDLIISDVFMPEADGLTTTKRLKEDLRTSHIPVVLLTARSSHEQRLEGLGTMADAYLTKPFNLEVLQATLHNMLSNRELLKQKFTSELPSSGNKEIGKIDKKFINDLASIVEANLANENLSVEEISVKIGLSRVQLYRKVKALLNSSVAEYILNRRLQKARYMLLNEPDLSIAEITFKTGFTSPNYFATVFKANYQCTPSDFRKNA
ncbi:MAG: response regulator, partial [Pedobacter sp.]